ncbi:uncharacterized protein Fot_01033 [Forsythia ovata]|uniref:Uncharacterized protein n=1 Tax=Forsythia ovata TaxID=205694 RepID=A0ABD1X334_9LAMI
MGNSLSLREFDISSCISRLGRGRNNRIFKVERPDSSLTGTPPPPVEAEAEPPTAVKRIKVVITKQQLQELLSKRTSIEAVILGIDSDSQTSWKPILQPIPEEKIVL